MKEDAQTGKTGPEKCFEVELGRQPAGSETTLPQNMKQLTYITQNLTFDLQETFNQKLGFIQSDYNVSLPEPSTFICFSNLWILKYQLSHDPEK